jgi:hypothetical protein
MTWSDLKVAVDYAEMGDNRGQFTLSPLAAPAPVHRPMPRQISQE